MSLIDGNYGQAVLYFAALVLLCAVFSVLIWRIKADFYEDALQSADELQKKTEDAAKGVVTRKKERSQKIARNKELGGMGASAFFWKTVYNRRRFAKFLVFTPTMVTYVGTAALIGVFLRFAIQTKLLLPVGVLTAVVIFFRNLGNPLAVETSHPFFFLAPENPFQKVRFALMGGLYETALDLIPAGLATAVIVQGNMVELLLWFVLWLSFDVFCSMVGLFLELALPSSIVPAIAGMLGISIRMAAILPGIILIVVGAVTNILPALLGVIALNLAVTGLLYAVAPRFLHMGKN